MTTSHAAEPAPEHPPRPTLAQIEAAATRPPPPRVHAEASCRHPLGCQAPGDGCSGPCPVTPAQAAGIERQLREQVERPAPERVDWQARVEAIAARSRPVRRRAAQEQTTRQRRIEEARRERAVGVTLDRLARRFDRFADAEVEHPTVVAWVAATRRGARDGLVLRGPVGTGKTHAAVAAYRAVVRAGVLPAIAVPVPALLDGLRPGREAVEHLDACESARLLLLDDLAAERATDWTAETLYRLIDARYARRLPTIVTMNATGKMIRETLGDRIASRLNGLGPHVVLDGPDRRTPREG